MYINYINMFWKRNTNWNKDDLELGTWNLSILCVFSLRWISLQTSPAHIPCDPFSHPTTPKHLSPSQTHFPIGFFSTEFNLPNKIQKSTLLQIPNPTPPCHGHAGYRPRAGTLHAALAPGRCRCQRGGSDRRRCGRGQRALECVRETQLQRIGGGKPRGFRNNSSNNNNDNNNNNNNNNNYNYNYNNNNNNYYYYYYHYYYHGP